LIDFTREPVDVAIRSGTGDWRGLSADRLMETDFTPMLSPKLAESVGGIQGSGRPVEAADHRAERSLVASMVRGRRRDIPASKRDRAASWLADLRGERRHGRPRRAILTPAFYGERSCPRRLLQAVRNDLQRWRGYWLVYAGRPPQRPEDQGVPQLDPR
jgi:LysR family glycine cleavage system transcriptional activator